CLPCSEDGEQFLCTSSIAIIPKYPLSHSSMILSAIGYFLPCLVLIASILMIQKYGRPLLPFPDSENNLVEVKSSNFSLLPVSNLNIPFFFFLVPRIYGKY